MTSTDSLIRNLAGSVAPVRRRSLAREVGALFGLAALELILVLMLHGMRPDMSHVIMTPYMGWKIASLIVLAGASCAAALRSFTPRAVPVRRFPVGLVLLGLVAITGIFASSSIDGARPLLVRLAPAHGLLCTASIVVLAMPLMTMLGVMMRRGAPVYPGRSASAAGLAASTSAALVFTVCCPMNDPLYIFVWYSLGVALVAAGARWLLPLGIRL